MRTWSPRRRPIKTRLVGRPGGGSATSATWKASSATWPPTPIREVRRPTSGSSTPAACARPRGRADYLWRGISLDAVRERHHDGEADGNELLLLLRIAESGSRGFAGVSGVISGSSRRNRTCPARIWTATARSRRGSSIVCSARSWPTERRSIPSGSTRLATFDFLVTGGDDLGWFFSKIPAERIDAGRTGRPRRGRDHLSSSRRAEGRSTA